MYLINLSRWKILCSNYVCGFYFIAGAALRVATAASKPGLPPQYTVVSVAQPRVIQATQITQVNFAEKCET